MSFIFPNTMQPEPREWIVVGVFSLAIHFLILLWFSAIRGEIPEINLSEFQVGLISSEGIGASLEASMPELTTPQVVEAQEVPVPIDELPAVVEEVAVSENIQIADDFEPIELSYQETTHVVEDSVPESTLQTLPDEAVISDSTQQIEEQVPVVSEVIELPGEVELVNDSLPIASDHTSSEIDEIQPINHYFKPAEVMSPDPVNAMPIEDLAEVPAPDAISPDNNPLLAKADVEILEVKAMDLLVPDIKPAPRAKAKPPVTKTAEKAETKTESLNGEPASNSGENNANGASNSSSKSSEKETKQEEGSQITMGYLKKIGGRLGSYKLYPEEARSQGYEGIAVIKFKIDRMGQVLTYSIARSTGHEVLDRAAEEMVKRASPFPVIPDDVTKQTLELMVPVRFRLDQ